MDLILFDFWSLEFWMALQLIFDLIIVLLIIRALKSIRQSISITMPDMENTAKEAVEQMIATIEPILKDAEKKSRAFESQIKEKNETIVALNERLDKRMISLNLILSRLEKVQSAVPEHIGSGARAPREEKLTERRKPEEFPKEVSRYSKKYQTITPDETDNTETEAEEGYNRKEAIIRLSEKGLDASEIARKLSLPKGEVELVLELHKKMTGA